jgi:1-acyl-sn-glycerol-3-phosphate acyltransferase
MWYFWGLFFVPFKIFKIIKMDYNTNYFKSLQTPMIIASNHRNSIDPLTIGIAIFPKLTLKLLPLAPYAAPLHRLQRPGQKIAKAIGFIQAVYYLFNIVYIPEGVSFSKKLAPLVNAVKAGETILIFPEGRSYTEDIPRTFKNGVAALHTITNAPIIPCAVHYYKKGLIPHATVSFGAPFSVSTSEREKTDEEIAEIIRKAVARQYKRAVQYDMIQA